MISIWIYTLQLSFVLSTLYLVIERVLDSTRDQFPRHNRLAFGCRWLRRCWEAEGSGAHGSCVSPQARLNCKHCGKPVIDVRIGMQYFSEYSNVQQCPHCGNLDYHFVKPFSSFKVLEAYWWKLCFGNSYFIDIITLLHIFSRKTFCDSTFFSKLKESSFVCVCH